MLYLVLPVASHYGWGVCGKYLSLELARIGPTTLLADRFSPADAGDELKYLALKAMVRDRSGLAEQLASNRADLDGPVIQAVSNADYGPLEPRIRGRANIGYTFFEDPDPPPQATARLEENFDVVVTGSRWCEEVLNRCGVRATRTIVQGVDRAVFNPQANDKKLFQDRFVIFSGGKFELRKGQDLVLKAVAVLAERHPEVLLVASWFNPWPQSLATMAASPHLAFEAGDNFAAAMERAVASAGLDRNRVVLLEPKPNPLMAQIYKNTDLGLFPNRCEGGTNLVLMEYLACGKPAVVSAATGHLDVAGPHNAIMIETMGRLEVPRQDGKTVVWDDPDLDEIVAKLEWAFQHRDEIAEIGRAAAASMENLTWAAAARRFFNLAQRF